MIVACIIQILWWIPSVVLQLNAIRFDIFRVADKLTCFLDVLGSECTTSLSGCEAMDGIPGNKDFEMILLVMKCCSLICLSHATSFLVLFSFLLQASFLLSVLLLAET